MPLSQSRTPSEARLARALGPPRAGRQSDAAALSALPLRPGKEHAALPLALRHALPGRWTG